MSQDPWVDGRLDDEGPRPGERRAAILIAALVIGSVVLRGGLGSLLERGQRGPLGLCLLGLFCVLGRDAMSSWPALFTQSGAMPAKALAVVGWGMLVLSLLVEVLSRFL